MAAQPICEYVDVSGTRLEIAIRVPGIDAPVGTRFTLAVRRRNGRIVAQSRAEVIPRVNAVGVWSNSALRFDIGADALPQGSFRLELIAEHDQGDVALVEPSTGLLASSRPLLVAGRRMQFFPSAGRPALWLRIAPDTAVDRVAWTVRNAVRDVAFAAHGRRFSWVRLARLLTHPVVPTGPIWLIGERSETARDNGRALFAHLRETRPEAAVYYVISAQSPMRGAVEPLGNVLTHSSWRHRVMMLHADVLANAYSIKHMLPSRWHPGAYMWQATWRIGARRVYLKHGVHLSPYAVKRANGGYDLLASVGEQESEALIATSGYQHHVQQTGLARYDALVRPAQRSRTIVFMPTWRRYLVPTLFRSADDAEIPFQGSVYQRFLDAFLGSPELAELLEVYDLRLLMVPHYNLAPVLALPEIASERIEVLDAATADIPGLLRSCDLLLTDYSSVQFDVAYLGTPVVYCQFDEQEYSEGHGAFSWFEAGRDGFGPVTRDVDSTIEAIRRYAERGFDREAIYEARVESVFAHQDRRNCARLVQAIDALRAPDLAGATEPASGQPHDGDLRAAQPRVDPDTVTGLPGSD
ncbi:hypothetical protein BH23ACT6_BH23ACT6_20100 [soil metagenome]